MLLLRGKKISHEKNPMDNNFESINNWVCDGVLKIESVVVF